MLELYAKSIVCGEHTIIVMQYNRQFFIIIPKRKAKENKSIGQIKYLPVQINSENMSPILPPSWS